MTSRKLSVSLLITLAVSLLAACGGDDASLDARVMQLSLTYSMQGPSTASMSGGSGAASAGALVECRYAEGDQPLLGSATANDVGAFEMTLDPAPFPQKLPSTQEYSTLNELVECRTGGGGWVTALRQVKLAIG